MDLDIVVAGAFLLIAGGATHCAALTRRDRDYWPMLRVLWAAIAFVYGGSALGVIVGGNRNPINRAAFAAVALAAVAYSVWFMLRRNRLARFLGLTVGGDIILRSVAELEAASILAESWAAHGVMPPDRVAGLRTALAEWERQQAWKADLLRQARGRREREI